MWQSAQISTKIWVSSPPEVADSRHGRDERSHWGRGQQYRQPAAAGRAAYRDPPSPPVTKVFGAQPSVREGKQFAELLRCNRKRLEKLLIGWQIQYNRDLGRRMMDAVASIVAAGRGDREVYATLYSLVHGKELDFGARPPESTAASAAVDAVPETTGPEKDDPKPKKSADVSYASSKKRANSRVKEIIGIINGNRAQGSAPITSFLDIGCADGSITGTLAEELGITSECAHGVDIAGLGEKYSQGRDADPRMSFSVYDGAHLEMHGDDSLGLVVALMSLHHVEDIQTLLAEVYRVLQPNGLFVIREHDCNSNETAVYLDLVHGLYALVWRDPPEDPTFLDEGGYHSAFRSKGGWVHCITSSGFAECSDTAPNGQQRQYYHGFRKVGARSEGQSRSRNSGIVAPSEAGSSSSPLKSTTQPDKLTQLTTSKHAIPAAGRGGSSDIDVPARDVAASRAWREHTSSTTGKTYYYNSVTKESVYEMPDVFVKSCATKRQADDLEAGDDENSGDSKRLRLEDNQ